jgi:hypothetical protein
VIIIDLGMFQRIEREMMVKVRAVFLSWGRESFKGCANYLPLVE